MRWFIFQRGVKCAFFLLNLLIEMLKYSEFIFDTWVQDVCNYIIIMWNIKISQSIIFTMNIFYIFHDFNLKVKWNTLLRKTFNHFWIIQSKKTNFIYLVKFCSKHTNCILHIRFIYRKIKLYTTRNTKNRVNKNCLHCIRRWNIAA